ncbi:MAG TPA: hypothetical protein PKX15_05995 [Bacteroidales bacterium]|nr:hypothetical protein [Bacteroidales bacterium]
MKTKVTRFIVLFMSLGISLLHAQQIQEETIEYNKKSVNAVSVEIPDLDVKTTIAAMEKFMENNGLKKSKMGSFNAYFNQPFPKIGTENYDMYTTVLSKGKRKSQKTYAYFLLAKGNENFVNSTNSPAEITNVKALLMEFATYTIEFALEQKIMHTKEVIADLEKDHKSLIKSKEKSQKKIEKETKKIEKTDNQVKEKTEEINKLKSQLQQFESQLKK